MRLTNLMEFKKEEEDPRDEHLKRQSSKEDAGDK